MDENKIMEMAGEAVRNVVAQMDGKHGLFWFAYRMKTRQQWEQTEWAQVNDSFLIIIGSERWSRGVD